jgi:hypothetical protein
VVVGRGGGDVQYESSAGQTAGETLMHECIPKDSGAEQDITRIGINITGTIFGWGRTTSESGYMCESCITDGMYLERG